MDPYRYRTILPGHILTWTGIDQRGPIFRGPVLPGHILVWTFFDKDMDGTYIDEDLYCCESILTRTYVDVDLC